MARFKLTLEYEGTRYRGWQVQKNARTVAGEIGEAVRRFSGRTDFELYGSGRTDAGVHALGQVAHLDLNTSLDPQRLVYALNDELPADIDVLAAERVGRRFHARHDAVGRVYLYQVSRRRTALGKPFVWWVKDALDLAAMREAARLFEGLHDFRSFADVKGDEEGRVKVGPLELAEAGSLDPDPRAGLPLPLEDGAAHGGGAGRGGAGRAARPRRVGAAAGDLRAAGPAHGPAVGSFPRARPLPGRRGAASPASRARDLQIRGIIPGFRGSTTEGSMGDAGEGLIDAQDDLQERLAEREQQREWRAGGPRVDPVRERERKSLDLARAELQDQAETATHPLRRTQIETALAEIERRIAALQSDPSAVPRLVASFLSRDQEFQVLQAQDARLAAARHGLDIEIVFADSNAVQQIQQLFRFIHLPPQERPAAIVVETVTGEGLERVARNAVQAGMGWVLLNRKVGYLTSCARSTHACPSPPWARTRERWAAFRDDSGADASHWRPGALRPGTARHLGGPGPVARCAGRGGQPNRPSRARRASGRRRAERKPCRGSSA